MNADDKAVPADPSAPRPEPDGHEDSDTLARKAKKNPNQPLPNVGAPLDGRQYLDVLEEQQHAERQPTSEGGNR